MDRIVPIIKGPGPKQILYCVVSEPHTEDDQGDVLDEEEIEKMAHGYQVNSRLVSESHLKKGGTLVLADASIVETYIAPVSFEIGNERIVKGSWVVAIKVNDPEMWAQVESGIIDGLSIGGTGIRTAQ